MPIDAPPLGELSAKLTEGDYDAFRKPLRRAMRATSPSGGGSVTSLAPYGQSHSHV